MKKSESGFTLPELLVVMVTTGLFTSLLLFFMISFWRYGLLLEADLDTLVTRLNAGDYLRENINPASGLIIQNSIADLNPGNPDTSVSPVNYWLPIHAQPGTIPIGVAGTITPLIYFKRPVITTTNTVAFNGTQPYEDEFVLYLNGTTKELLSRTLANPNVVNNKLVTSCPAASATNTCPADKIVASDISSIAMRYFSKNGNLINYTSSYDSSTNEYTGPDFPLVEVVEFNLNLTKKPYFQKSDATFNSTVIRIAIRS